MSFPFIYISSCISVNDDDKPQTVLKKVSGLIGGHYNTELLKKFEIKKLIVKVL